MCHVIRWDKSKYLGACRNAANAPRNFLAFAGMLQAPRKTFWSLQERCKRLEKLFGLCRNAANASKNFLAFAGMLQMPRKTFWTLQERCKRHKKLFGLCRNAANAFEKRAVRMRGKIYPSEGRGDKTTRSVSFNRSEGAMRGHTRRNEAVTSGCARRVQIVVTTMVSVRVAMCSGDVHLRIPLFIIT